MKRKNPTKSKISALAQICKIIPEHLVSELARKHGVDKKARTFSAWSHVTALMYAQITHSIGLNDVCDGLQNHRTALAQIRGATPPSKNALSHANMNRSSQMAEDLFWRVFEHITKIEPGFSPKQLPKGMRNFHRKIYIIDSTTIELIANCVNWALHRRRKAAAKCHLRLDLQSFLPNFAIIDTAREGDNKRSRELCADLKDGEVVIFDRAYIDYRHLHDLEQRGVIWVSRARESMSFDVVENRSIDEKGPIIEDQLIMSDGRLAKKKYPIPMRRIKAWIEVDGKMRVMSFITNHLEWSAKSILQLYKCRWSIEIFFKQIKQTLQLSDFLGHSANAIRWQVWIALLVYLLIRLLAYRSSWTHSFTRLFTFIRGVIWDKYWLQELLRSCGTAEGSFRMLGNPQQAYLPGFS